MSNFVSLMGLVSIPPFSSSNFCSSKLCLITHANKALLIYAYGCHVLVFDSNIKLQLLIETQSHGKEITAISVHEGTGIIAIGYDREVELVRLVVDKKEDVPFYTTHAIVLSQQFSVKALAWKKDGHLAVFGGSIALWECTIPSLGTHGVWMCTFVHHLPVTILYAVVSPNDNYFATIGDDGAARVLSIGLVLETSHLKSELGRLLGRSFSQSLEFFGSSSLLYYCKLFTDYKVTELYWRPLIASEKSINALLIRTSKTDYYYVEDRGQQSDYNLLFNMQFCREFSNDNSKGFYWWNEDIFINNPSGKSSQTFGAGNACLIDFSPSDTDPLVYKLSNVDDCYSSIVSLDKLINANVTWITARPYCCTMFREDLAVSFGKDHDEIFVYNLITSDLESMDFAYDLIARSRPMFDNVLSSIVSHSENILLIETLPNNWTIFTKEYKTLGMLKNVKKVFVSKQDTVYFLSDDLLLQALYLKEDGHHEKKALDCLTNDLLGLIDAPDKSCCLIAGSGQFILVVDDQLNILHKLPYLELEASKKRHAFGTENCPILLEYDQDCLSYTKISSDEAFSLGMYDFGSDVNSKCPFVTSDFGDLVFLDCSSQLFLVTLSPALVNFISVTKIAPLTDVPLFMTFGSLRELYVIFNDGIAVYRPELTDTGDEKWTKYSFSSWPPPLPSAINGESSAIHASSLQNEHVLFCFDGMLFDLYLGHQDAEDDDYCCGLSFIPDSVHAYRSINQVAVNNFDDCVPIEPDIDQPTPNKVDRRKRLQKEAALSSDQVFSFFEDVNFFEESSDFETDGLDKGKRELQLEPLSRTMSQDTRKTSTPKPSVNTSCVGRLRQATLEASNLLGKYKDAVDYAGCKYIYFAMLSFEMGDCLFSKGFEYIAGKFSDAQEVLIEVTQKLMHGPPLTWSHFSFFGMGYWMRNEQRLRELLEEVARADFVSSKSDPAVSAILYLILGRKQLLKTLWKNCSGSDGSKMVAFLSKDFDDEKVKIIAVKNAFAALAKQKPYLALFFFLLSCRLEDALQVCFERIQDYHLAYLIMRFLCSPSSVALIVDRFSKDKKLLPTCIRAIFVKFCQPDKDLLTLLVTDITSDASWAEKSGVCLTLACYYLRERTDPLRDQNIMFDCIRSLCKSGCYNVASSVLEKCMLSNESQRAVPAVLVLQNLVRIWADRWDDRNKIYNV